MASILADAQKIAKNVFGFDGLRPFQAETIKAVMDGHDVFVRQPTGGGKSMNYVIPSLMCDGLVIVWSPLIALMEDQVNKLKRVGIKAARLSSDLPQDEVDRITRRAKDYRILFVAPERLKSSSFMRMLDKTPISFVAVDESHMLSFAAKDFRPAYTMIGSILKTKLARVPRMALTATADIEVEKDIVRSLGMQEYVRVMGPMSRPNLTYEVVRDATPRGLIDWMKDEGFDKFSGSAIVYCATRQSVMDMAHTMRMSGLHAEPYHAGMSGRVRTETQTRWMKGECQFIVSTNAFGMGIDKPDVRLVLHADTPGSLYDYQQEAGRAGRDGKPSKCLLNITAKGLKSRRFFIRTANPRRDVYNAIWESWRKHSARQPFMDNTLNLLGPVFSCGGIGKFDAPSMLDAAINYMEYSGAITTMPDKTVHTFRPRDRGQLMMMARRYRNNIRVKLPNTVYVTVFPNQEDITPMLWASHAIHNPDNLRPVRHFKVLKKRLEHGITEEDIAEKRRAAEDRLKLLLDFAACSDKSRFLERVFSGLMSQQISDTME